MHETLEYAQFTLRPGVGDHQLQAAAQSLNDGFLKQQPGYLRRELVKLDGRTYADLIWWRSHDEASAAMEKAMKSPACATYFGIMDLNAGNPDEAVKHYSVVARYVA
jgi:hypothetical protein